MWLSRRVLAQRFSALVESDLRLDMRRNRCASRHMSSRWVGIRRTSPGPVRQRIPARRSMSQLMSQLFPNTTILPRKRGSLSELTYRKTMGTQPKHQFRNPMLYPFELRALLTADPFSHSQVNRTAGWGVSLPTPASSQDECREGKVQSRCSAQASTPSTKPQCTNVDDSRFHPLTRLSETLAAWYRSATANH